MIAAELADQAAVLLAPKHYRQPGTAYADVSTRDDDLLIRSRAVARWCPARTQAPRRWVDDETLLAHRARLSNVPPRAAPGRRAIVDTSIEAFLDGPDGSHGVGGGGQDALAAIRAERAQYPETAKFGVQRKVGIPREDREDEVLAKRLLVQKLGRQRRGVVAIPYEDAAWWYVSLFDEVYVTDASQTGVHHRKVDPARAAELQKRLVLLLARFIREAPAAQQRWRAAQVELTTRENWARLCGV